jgi:hypothetical protein
MQAQPGPALSGPAGSQAHGCSSTSHVALLPPALCPQASREHVASKGTGSPPAIATSTSTTSTSSPPPPPHQQAARHTPSRRRLLQADGADGDGAAGDGLGHPGRRLLPDASDGGGAATVESEGAGMREGRPEGSEAPCPLALPTALIHGSRVPAERCCSAHVGAWRAQASRSARRPPTRSTSSRPSRARRCQGTPARAVSCVYCSRDIAML